MPSMLVSPSRVEAGFGHPNPGRGGEPNTGIETLSTSTSLFIPKPHLTARQNGEELETRARTPSTSFLPLPPKTLSGNLSPSYAIKRWEIGQSRLGSYFQRPLKLFLQLEKQFYEAHLRDRRWKGYYPELSDRFSTGLITNYLSS